jgi:hypothetical protein
MKKNRLVVAVTITKFYQYPTDAETADVAFDEYTNQTGRRFRKIAENTQTEISEFGSNILSVKEALQILKNRKKKCTR